MSASRVDQDHLATLLEFGYDEALAVRALRGTNSSGVEAATDWLASNSPPPATAGLAAGVGALGGRISEMASAFGDTVVSSIKDAATVAASLEHSMTGPTVRRPPPQLPPKASLPVFEHRPGALGLGNDVLVGEFTLAQAKERCAVTPAAVGFTFCSDDRNPQGKVRCYFKSSAIGNSDMMWHTYLQRAAPAPAVLPAASAVSQPPPGLSCMAQIEWKKQQRDRAAAEAGAPAAEIRAAEATLRGYQPEPEPDLAPPPAYTDLSRPPPAYTDLSSSGLSGQLSSSSSSSSGGASRSCPFAMLTALDLCLHLSMCSLADHSLDGVTLCVFLLPRFVPTTQDSLARAAALETTVCGDCSTKLSRWRRPCSCCGRWGKPTPPVSKPSWHR